MGYMVTRGYHLALLTRPKPLPAATEGKGTGQQLVESLRKNKEAINTRHQRPSLKRDRDCFVLSLLCFRQTAKKEEATPMVPSSLYYFGVNKISHNSTTLHNLQIKVFMEWHLLSLSCDKAGDHEVLEGFRLGW